MDKKEKTVDRYSVITEKNKREIVLLKGLGCVYKKCPFCDYYNDSSPNEEENFALNRAVLAQVTGKYGKLEVINSGSVFELDLQTLALIQEICKKQGIGTIHFESHYLYHEKIPALRRQFSDFQLKLKLGLETFDYEFRETVFKKGIPEKDPALLSAEFDEANFLFGITGQSLESMQHDLEMGLQYFERICVNLMCENTSPLQPDKRVIQTFTDSLYPLYKENERVDILLNNTDFGVGE